MRGGRRRRASIITFLLGGLGALAGTGLWLAATPADGDPSCERTWTGGGADGSILDPANWGGASPVTAGTGPSLGLHGCIGAGAAAVVDGEASVGGLTVSAGASLTLRATLGLDGTGLVNDGEVVFADGFPTLALGGTTFENRAQVRSDAATAVINDGRVVNGGSWELSDIARIGESGPVDFVHEGGDISGTGLFRMGGGSFTWGDADVSASTPPLITGSTAVTVAGTGAGAIEVGTGPGEGHTIAGTIGPAKTVRVVDGFIAAAGPITNAGTLELTGSFPHLDLGASTLTNTGTLRADAMIAQIDGGTVDNTGAVVNEDGLWIGEAAPTTFRHRGGTIDGAGRIRYLNGTFDWASATITGAAPQLGGTTAVVLSGSGAGGIELGTPSGAEGPTQTLQGTIAAGRTVDIDSASTVTAAGPITNHGTIGFIGSFPHLALGTQTLVNDGIIRSSAMIPAIDGGTIVNTGTLRNDDQLWIGETSPTTFRHQGGTIDGAGRVRFVSGTFEWGPGTVTGGVPQLGGTTALVAGATGDGTVELGTPSGAESPTQTMRGTIAAGSTVRLAQGDVTASGPITNDGTIAFTDFFPALDLAGQTLANRGTISGGAAIANLDGGALVSTGTIDITSDLQVGQRRPLALTHAGGAISGTARLVQHSGSFAWSGGDVTATTPPRIGGTTAVTLGGVGRGDIDLSLGNAMSDMTLAGTIGTAQRVTVTAFTTVTAAAPITNRGTLTVESLTGGLHLDGATLDNEGTVAVAGNSDIVGGTVENRADGDVQVSDRWNLLGTTLRNAGHVTAASEIVISAGGRFVNLPGGTSSGAGPIQAGDAGSAVAGVGTVGPAVEVLNDASMQPGQSPGILNVPSVILGGSTDIELGGTTPGTGHDQLNVAGNADLAGTLNLIPFGGYAPKVCDTFTIMTWGTRSGSFASVTGTAIGGGLTLVPVYQPDRLVVVATTTGSPISLGPTAVGVAEGGATAGYDICVGDNPAANVTVTPAPDTQVGVAPAPVTFTPGGALSKTVTVSAVDDLAIEGVHAGTVTHTSASADALYDALVLPDVVATIADNDLAVGAPVAADDAGVTNEDTPVNVDVVANDTDDVALDPASVTIVAPPGRGTATANPDGAVTYTPGPDLNGPDSFTYVVDDLVGNGSNLATVSMTVNPQPDAPVANPDGAVTTRDVPVDITVTTNDTDVDLDPLSVVAVDPASANGGSIVVSGTGSVGYTPPPGFTGADSFTYTVGDGTGLTDVGTVLVSVVAGVFPPTAANDVAGTDEDVPVVIDVLGNDSDSDGTLDPTSVTVTSPPGRGAAAPNPDGTITYTPSPNRNGLDVFSYRVRDDAALSSGTATVTVTVTPVNDAPVARDDRVRTASVPVTIDVLANDTDPDGDDLSVLRIPATTERGGRITLLADGTVRYTPPTDEGPTTTTTTPTSTTEPTTTTQPTTTGSTTTGSTTTGSTTTGSTTTEPTTTTDPATTGSTRPTTSEPPPTEPPPRARRSAGAGELVGTDSFAYAISDGNGGVASALVLVTSTALVTPPASTTTAAGGSTPPTTAPTPTTVPGSGPAATLPRAVAARPAPGRATPALGPSSATVDEVAVPTTAPSTTAPSTTSATTRPGIATAPRAVAASRLSSGGTVIRGRRLTFEGRAGRPCRSVAITVGEQVLGRATPASDGTFRIPVDTLDLELGTHTASLVCADDGLVLARAAFLTVQPADTGWGGAQAGSLLGVLIFLLLALLAAVSVPARAGDAVEDGDHDGGDRGDGVALAD